MHLVNLAHGWLCALGAYAAATARPRSASGAGWWSRRWRSRRRARCCIWSSSAKCDGWG
nr:MULTISPECIES: hypothetical protein [unclassified Paracoccus (in: a-proteobacteria)]